MTNKITCPRRKEGSLGYGEENQDEWTLENWKFTNEESAKQYNINEARQKTVEDNAKGRNVDRSYVNKEYWLWRLDFGPIPMTCSYCGGLNPEDVLALVKVGWEIEMSDKGYKAYLHPPGYHNKINKMLHGMKEGFDPIEQAEKHASWSPCPPTKIYLQHFTQEQIIQVNQALKARKAEE